MNKNWYFRYTALPHKSSKIASVYFGMKMNTVTARKPCEYIELGSLLPNLKNINRVEICKIKKVTNISDDAALVSACNG